MTEIVSKTAIPGRGRSTLAVRVDAQELITEVIWSQVYKRDNNAVSRARTVATAIVSALRREGLITGTVAVSSEQVLAAVVNYAGQFGEAPKRGISHLVAEALVLLDLPVVHRDVLQALMPEIDVSHTKSTVAMLFGRAIQKFHRWAWINRTDDGLITVLDRDALTKWFEIAEDVNEKRAATTFDIAKAVRKINADFAAGMTDELRRRELAAIQRLMESAPGAVTNERGTVRIVPKSRMV